MAGPFDAGTVSARLILNLDEWSANLEKAKKDTSTFAGAVTAHKVEIEQLGKTFAVVGGAIVGSLGLMLKSATDFTLEAGRMSQKTGIAVETISGLREAASKTGVSMDTLNVGLRRFASIAVDAASGNKTAIKSLDDLGIKATDVHGKLKPMDQLLMEAADHISKMADGNEKAALATDLFGRSGTEMILMLNKGSSGIKGFIQDNEDMGNAITQEGVAKAKAFSISMGELDDSFMSIKLVIANALMPIVKGLADMFTSVSQAVRKLTDVFPVFTNIMTPLVGIIGGLLGIFGGVLLILPKLAAGWIMVSGGIKKMIESTAAAITANPVLAITLLALMAAYKIVTGAIDDYAAAQEEAMVEIAASGAQQTKTWKWIGETVHGATTDMSVSIKNYIAVMRGWGWDSEEIADKIHSMYGKLIDKTKEVASAAATLSDAVISANASAMDAIKKATLSEYQYSIWAINTKYDAHKKMLEKEKADAASFALNEKARNAELTAVYKTEAKKQQGVAKAALEKILEANKKVYAEVNKIVNTMSKGVTADFNKTTTKVLLEMQKMSPAMKKVMKIIEDASKNTFKNMVKHVQKWIQAAKPYIDGLREAFSIVADAINQKAESNLQKEYNRLDKEYDKQRSILDKEYAAKKAAMDKIAADEAYAAQVKAIMGSNMTKAEKDAALAALETEKKKSEAIATMDQEYADAAAALEEKLAADKKALDIKSAESKKKAGITQAIIGTALAVVSALSTNPFIPMGIIAAALALVAGMAQIAIIKSAPAPMAEGGLVKQATHVLAGEAGPEAILPMRELKRMLGLTPNAGGKTINVSVSAIDASGFDRLISGKMIPRLKRALTNESLTIPVKAVRG